MDFRTIFRLTRAVTPSFAVRLPSGATVLIAIAVMLAIHSSIGLAQSPTAPAPAGDAKREWPPSVIGAGTFVSLEGRFSVSLPPQNHGLQRLSIATPFGLAKGDSYVWRMKEASFVIGYADAAQAVDDPDTAKQVFTSLREEVKKLAAANHGEVGAEKQIELDKHPGIEQRIELFTGLIVQRTYLVSHRLYQTVLVVNTTQRTYEATAASVLDTFKILSRADVTTRLAQEAARTEPSPLPQQPVAQRLASDADDEGLHGRVKTVLTESQDLSGTWSVQTRKRNSLENYNEQGNLTRRESYDYKGNLFDITVYGYIDGSRVSYSETIQHEYNPPPMIVRVPPGIVTRKSDSRYHYKFAFKYDDKKRLTEKTWFHSNGELWLRYVYKYTGNQREELVYSEDGSVNQRYVSILDDKGNEVEETIFETRDGSIRSKQSYAYEFDSNGNWTKRTTSRLVPKDGKPTYVPASVYYRTITYYR